MPPPPQNRPSTFVVTANNDPSDAAYELTRERSVLQPGEVRTPAVRPTPLIGDWARNDSSTWEFKEADGHPGCTPLNSYGGKDDLWSVPGGAAGGAHDGRDDHLDDDDAAAETAMVQSTIQQALAAATHDSQHHNNHSAQQDAYHHNNFPHQYHQHHQQQQQHTHHHDGGAGGFQVDEYAAGHHHAAFSNSAPHAALLSQGMLVNSNVSAGGGGSSMRPASMSAGKFTRFTVQHSTMPSSGVPMSSALSMMPVPPPLVPVAGAGPLVGGDGALTPELGSRQSSSDAASLLAKFRSQSEILSDELYFQAKSFPPPPSPNPPAETRRIRAELWYLVARKWDITQQMPPPPRSPLPGMEEEHRLKLQELTRVPYRGDRWLAQSDRWFHWVQEHFVYPPESTANVLSPQYVISMCA